jgi:nitrogen regulatory protein P-II 1
MQRITAVIRAEKLDEVRAALEVKGYPGLMVVRIEGHGQQKGLKQQFRGREYTVELIPKIKLELVVKDGDVRPIAETIIQAARTGNVGDGKIFVSPVTEVFRIRTGEEGETAI